jgi:integrase
MVTKRGKNFFLRIRPFGGKEIGVKTQARSKTEAKQIEMAVMTACRSGDYSGLDPVSREVCLRLFLNRGLQIPAGLGVTTEVREELTLWKAIELCIKYPEVYNSPNRERHEQAFVRVVEKWGKDFPVKSIWIPQLKEYQILRLQEGAAPSTVNKEKAALSKMFQVLIELRHVDVNPARLVKNVSEKNHKRGAYVSLHDFQSIVAVLPPWFRPIAQTAYYTGMRRGEVLSLTRGCVHLDRRIVVLGAEETKEGQRKKVPIHCELLPILENALKVQAIGTDRVFLHNGKPVTHRDEVRWCWDRKVINVDGLDPVPRFHDLRHTWKTNARRSGMHPEIEKAIMGHSSRARNVHEGYGLISDDELIKAIDAMTFDHGETEIFVGTNSTKKSRQRIAASAGTQKNAYKTRTKAKSSVGATIVTP